MKRTPLYGACAFASHTIKPYRFTSRRHSQKIVNAMELGLYPTNKGIAETIGLRDSLFTNISLIRNVPELS